MARASNWRPFRPQAPFWGFCDEALRSKDAAMEHASGAVRVDRSAGRCRCSCSCVPRRPCRHECRARKRSCTTRRSTLASDLVMSYVEPLVPITTSSICYGMVLFPLLHAHRTWIARLASLALVPVVPMTSVLCFMGVRSLCRQPCFFLGGNRSQLRGHGDRWRATVRVGRNAHREPRQRCRDRDRARLPRWP